MNTFCNALFQTFWSIKDLKGFGNFIKPFQIAKKTQIKLALETRRTTVDEICYKIMIETGSMRYRFIFLVRKL